MDTPIFIDGSGPAALAALVALKRKGRKACLIPDKYAPPEFGVVIDEGATKLLCTLFDSRDIVAGAHQLRRKVVRWGDPPVRAISQPAISLRNLLLRDRLRDAVKFDPHEEWPDHLPVSPAPWQISTMPDRSLLRMGSRHAILIEVALSRHADPANFCVEAVQNGWLMLAPLSDQTGVLQGVVPGYVSNSMEALSALLDSAPLISPLIDAFIGEASIVPCAPAFSLATVYKKKLLAGAAAMVLDPVCGDGTAQAIRSGLLAGVIASSAAEGCRSDAMMAHYNSRLRAAFRAHVDACLAAYSSGNFGRSWNAEIAVTRNSVDQFEPPGREHFRFKLENLDLVDRMGPEFNL